MPLAYELFATSYRDRSRRVRRTSALLADAALSESAAAQWRRLSAVVWAAFFNFIAFTVFGLHVADTMSTGVVRAGVVDPRVVRRRARLRVRDLARGRDGPYEEARRGDDVGHVHE